MKTILNIFFTFCLLITSQISFAALEIVMITFHKNTWVNPTVPNGVKWHYNTEVNQTYDLKKLINDADNPNSPIRSYVLEYDKGLTQFQRMNFGAQLNLNGAILNAVEVRARGNTGTPFELFFGNTKVGSEVIPQPMSGFGQGFRSIVIDEPQGNHQEPWLLKLNGTAEMNLIILNIYTNGQNCLRNKCS